jgi:PKD repeat protein
MKHISAIMIMLALVASVGIVSAAPGDIPSCDFTANITSGSEDLVVRFTATYEGMDIDTAMYEWDFGDDTGADKISGASVTHPYFNPGKYTVSLIVNDLAYPTTWWVRNTKTDYITVTNTPPIVSISPTSQTKYLGEKAEFTSTVSGNDPISYVWTFGDGHSVPPSGNEIIPTTGIIYEHTGTYSVTLAVTNDGGTTISAPVEVIVIPPVPVADFVGNPQIGMAPLAVKFFDITDPVMEVNSRVWAFGDGQTSTEKDPLHAYADVGLYDVALTVGNGYDNDDVTKTGYINVTNTSPYVCENTTVYVNQTEYVYVNTSSPEPAINNVGIFRKTTGIWYLDVDGDRLYELAERFGGATDIPVPGDYNGDTFSDIAIFRPSTGFWYIDTNRDGVIDIQRRFGGVADTVMPGDYNADGKADIAIFRPATGFWYIDTNLDGVIDISFRYGGMNDVPVIGNWGISTPN